MLRTPPDILITTPESLFLLLTSPGREMLKAIETVIVDPKLSDGPDDTDRVTGELDVVAALNGLVGLRGCPAARRRRSIRRGGLRSRSLCRSPASSC